MAFVSEFKDSIATLLKASGPKAAALSIACGVLIYLSRKNVVGIQLSSSVIQGLLIACVTLALLAAASFAEAVVPLAKKGSSQRLGRRRVKRYVVAQLPHLEYRERQIIAYLLKNNERMFATTVDAGYAGTLVAKGLVVNAMVPGQRCDSRRVPFKIPDHIWDVLMEHKHEFTYKQENVLPWCIPWNLR
jgi:hypothetical protein